MSEPQPTQPAPRPQLSPKEGFLGLDKVPDTWRGTVRSNIFTTTLIYALAEYATLNPSSEQMKGAQDFLKVLLTLAEPKSEPRGAFPDKRLSPVSPEVPFNKPEVKK